MKSIRLIQAGVLNNQSDSSSLYSLLNYHDDLTERRLSFVYEGERASNRTGDIVFNTGTQLLRSVQLNTNEYVEWDIDLPRDGMYVIGVLFVKWSVRGNNHFGW